MNHEQAPGMNVDCGGHLPSGEPCSGAIQSMVPTTLPTAVEIPCPLDYLSSPEIDEPRPLGEPRIDVVRLQIPVDHSGCMQLQPPDAFRQPQSRGS